MSTPTDWVHFYSNSTHLAPPGRATSSPLSPDSTIGPTSSSAPPQSAGTAAGGGAHLSPEGRVAKPVRRRSRASRRTPTTLLNTDTSNFRAMVQQFTGGPSAPFGNQHHHHGPAAGFGFGPRLSPNTAMVQPPMYHLNQYQQQQQQQYHHQQQQNYMFALNNSSNNSNTNTGVSGGGGGGGGDVFFQRLSSSRAPTMEVSNGYVMEMGSRQTAASSSSNENNRSNSYLF